jgi:ubiquinone/menaquinone biosynthesis C-methylase UbiE
MMELTRIKAAYEKRDIDGKSKLYSFLSPSAFFIIQQREKEIIRVLVRNGTVDLSNKKILDIGCGTGNVLRDFLKYGASPENLHGIDLLDKRIESAIKISPNMNFKCGSAENIPYEDNTFDIVLVFTVFTSVFDPNMKKKLAFEALRVLKPNGFILYYDYKFNNPKNPDVRGVGKKEITSLFPNCTFDFTLTTLAPPLVRTIAPYSWLLCYLLEKIPILRTHYLVTIQKNSKGTE